jgi:HK97 family phage prohead protease
MPQPRPDEDRASFLARCVEELDDGESDREELEDQCALIWSQSRSAATEGNAMNIVRKVHSNNADGLAFRLSDETPDRHGDVIRAAGWRLDSFRANSICLFQHDARFPIGVWKDVHVSWKELRGRLELAPKEASPRIAELHSLIGAGVLRATSVGFRAISSRPRTVDGKTVGIEFLEQELLECSICSLGSNPSALAIAKGLGISDDVRRLVFAKPGAVTRPPMLSGHRVAQAAFDKASADLARACEELARLQKLERQYTATPLPQGFNISQRERAKHLALAQCDLEQAQDIHRRILYQQSRVTLARLKLEDAADTLARALDDWRK